MADFKDFLVYFKKQFKLQVNNGANRYNTGWCIYENQLNISIT